MPKPPVASSSVAAKAFQEGDDPLKILLPWEQRAAELYVRLGQIPALTRLNGDPRPTPFLEALKRQEPSAPSTPYAYALLLKNPAFQAYVRRLREVPREGALAMLKGEAAQATDDYLWARTVARQEGDYKLVHQASADFLDRIGASEAPPKVAVQIATITLKSRIYEEKELLADSPRLPAESVGTQAE